jgi:hypothetical protein
MNTNHVSAAGAPTLFFLAFEERVDALCFYHFEVFNHAHAVSFSVACIEVIQIFARHLVAFIAEFDFTVG